MAERITVDQGYAALRDVIDPEIYQNIVDLGLVYGVAIGPANDVVVTMTLTTPHCPLGPQIIENVQFVLYKIGATSVDVRIVWEPMWTPDAMTDDLKRQLGLLPDEEEPELVFEAPPPMPQKKKGFLGRLFG